jgi:2-iminobutanoate/2-iminopropanoate deaminase
VDIRYVFHPDAPPGSPPLLVRAGDFIFVGEQTAAHPVTGLPEEAKLLPRMPWHGSAIQKQLNCLYTNLDKSLKEVGSSLHHIMKINSYHTQPLEVDMALRVRREWFGEDPPPSTLVLPPVLPVRDATVLIDMINLAADARLKREAVVTNAPAIAQVRAIGWAVYSQAMKGGGFVFTRGTVAHGPDGPLPETDPDADFPYRYSQIRFQTEYSLNRIKALLNDANCSLKDVVRAEIHLADLNDLAELDEVWRDFFPSEFPARVVVPMPLVVPNMRVEIEVIAVDPKGPYRKEIIATAKAPTPLSPESQAVKAGPYLFLSGQMATDYAEGIPVEAQPHPGFPYHSSAIKRQVEYICKNVETICQAGGTFPRNLVKMRAHYADLADMPVAERVWRGKLKDRVPPTTNIKVNALPVPGCKIQYDLIALVSK